MMKIIQSLFGTKKKEANPLLGLREMILNLNPNEIGLNKENFHRSVWGILMETGLEKARASLVVIADGTTSLYYSTGGGVLGAGKNPTVRTASEQFLNHANMDVARASRTTSFPLPARGYAQFYFLSFDGILTYKAPEIELAKGHDSFSTLFNAGHKVIVKLCEIERRMINSAN